MYSVQERFSHSSRRARRSVCQGQEWRRIGVTVIVLVVTRSTLESFDELEANLIGLSANYSERTPIFVFS